MSEPEIKKVAVIGSGVMGSQIAAHITNAGVPVLLLDIVAKDQDDRSAYAKKAIERMLKAEPSPFMYGECVKLIVAGNIEDDLDKISKADWIIEAVLENPQIKADLYRKIEKLRKSGSVVSSNTSTIPLANLIEGQGDAFARDFLITHFFNPPRYMKLLELVSGEKTAPNVVARISDFCDRQLGKGIVRCKDQPGFIANRLGIFFLQCGVNAAFEFGLTVEEADAVFSKPVGMPKTGVFGLIDLIGLDLMPLIAKSFLSTLPPDDLYRAVNIAHPLLDKMIADGFTGRKGKGGFYRVEKTQTGKTTLSIDLVTGEYRPSKKARPDVLDEAGDNLRMICSSRDNVGKFAWGVLSQVLVYAASLVSDIADDIAAVDAAMRLGFNWQYGPFELIDKLGVDWFVQKLQAEGRAVPDLLLKAAGRSFYRVDNGRLEYLSVDGEYACFVRPQGVLLLSDVKRASMPVLENGSASVWDIGDGVLCFEFHTKMNAIDEDIFILLKKTISTIEKSCGRFKGLVFYNEAEAFSAGANLGMALFAINISMYMVLGDLIRRGQETYHALKFARFPSVAAPAGMALGGGCEITLHCSAIQAHAETHMGLVEIGVGLIPCWGGCAQMLGRAFDKKGDQGALAAISHAFETIGRARQSKSAFNAWEMMFLRDTDGITMNRDRLLFDAKQRVLTLAKNYRPPDPPFFDLPGISGQEDLISLIETDLAAGKISAHDATVMKSLAAVLCGGDVASTTRLGEQQLMDLEHREFMKLQHMPQTAARIEHMLKTGKMLKN